jgi:hypothetical protein
MKRSLRAAAFVAALAVGSASAAEPAGDARDETGVQGRWAYSRQATPDAMIDMAATPSTQDADIWFLLACSADGRLSVALMHADRFPFQLDRSSLVQVQSARSSIVSVAAERSHPAQIVIDPALMGHIMPLILDEQEVAFAVTAGDGIVHRYIFALQPNDVALAPIRSRCLGD